MKKLLLLVLATIATAHYVEARKVSGKVSCLEKPVAGVVVTDGKSFTRTADDGKFTIDAADDADFVYILTPSGYVASYSSGTPCFYKPVNAKSFDFELYPYGTPGGKYAMLAVGDPQAGSDHDFTRMETEALPDLRQTAADYACRNIPAAAVMLGDHVWDNLDSFPRVKADYKSLGIPVYPVIGNHDHNLAVSDDHGSAGVYRQYFGPTYYAFAMGGDYYIVLDNIVYKGNKTYDEAIDEQQLKWVETLRQYIPKGSRVFVAMHCPAYIYYRKKVLAGSERLFDLLAAYNVQVLSGHTHVQSNMELRPGVFENMVGGLCGAWWIWDDMYCRDGTPMGYQVFESSPRQFGWYYKTLHKPADYQMQVIDMGTMPGHEDELCVKIWNWDEKWSVKWSEDGGSAKDMQLFTATDPFYYNYLARQYALGKGRVGSFRRPMKHGRMFFSCKPSAKARVVSITVTDRMGHVYKQDVSIRP